MFFKKKEDDFDQDLGPPLSNENNDFFKNEKETTDFNNFTASSMGSTPNSIDDLHQQGFTQQTNQQPVSQPTQQMDSKEYQVLTSKLDSIKSELDALMQHIIRIERDISSIKSPETNNKKPMW
jgi:hypothetical protein